MLGAAAVEPDFAFPKRVEQQAQEALRVALGRDNGPATLRALIDLSVAQSLIRPDEPEAVAQMLHAQAAKMRQPLTADVIRLLSTDVTGNYRLADSLMRSPASAALLRSAPLHDWRSVIAGNDAFFPTLYDFAAVIAARNSSLTDSVAAAMSDAHSKEILPRLYWLMLSANSSDQLARLCAQLSHLPESAFPLTALAQRAYSFGQRQAAYALCQQWLDTFTASPYRADVEAAVAHLTRPSLTIQGENLTAKGDVYRLKVSAICLNSASISWTNTKQPGAQTARRSLTFAGQGVFRADTVIEIPLSEYGVYRFVPIFKGQTDLRERDCLNVTVTDLLLARTTFGSKSNVQALNAKNGALLTDVRLSRQGNHVSATRGADRYSPSIWDGKEANDSREVYHHANIFTARGLYHPGDTLQFAATLIATSGGRSQLEPGKRTTIKLLNPNWQPIDSLTAVTDDYGRLSGSFLLPKEGLTGHFTLQIDRAATQSVVVAHYVAPTFEVTTTATRLDSTEVKVTGAAVGYNGFPMAQAQVKISLRRLPRWDWRSNFTNRGPQVADTTVTTDSQGTFAALIPCTADYNLTAEAQVTSPTGETHAATAFVAGRPYNIEVDIPSYVVPGKPLTAQVTNAQGRPERIPLIWTLTALNDTTPLSPDTLWTNVPSGSYALTIRTADPALAYPRTYGKITVYRPTDAMPPEQLALFVPETAAKPGDKLLVGTSYADSHIRLTLWDRDKIISQQWLTPAKGNFTLPIELPQGLDQATLTLSTLRNFKAYEHTVKVTRPQLPTSLQISVSSMRQLMEPGQTEHWDLRVTNNLGQPAAAALLLSVYSKALDAIHPFGWHFETSTFGSKQFYTNFCTAWPRECTTQRSTGFSALSITPPAFDTYGRLYPQSSPLYIRGRGMAQMNFLAATDAKMEAAEAAEAAPTSLSAMEEEPRLPNQVQALWMPSLTTAANGEVSLSFTAPNAVTTWRLLACAYNPELLHGTLARDIIVSKPVMVASRIPRIVTCGDSLLLTASVMNATDSLQSVAATFELFDPLSHQILTQSTSLLSLTPDSAATISLPLLAPNRSMLGVRVKATAGRFTDGEESLIAILPAEVHTGQARPFFVPADSTQITLQVPQNGVVTFTSNALWEVLTALPGLQANPSAAAPSQAAALFSAATARGLLRSYPAIASALHSWQQSDSLLLSALEQNVDLKIALLEHTPWPGAAQTESERKQRLLLLLDKRQSEKAQAEAIHGLAKLVRAGGIAWTPDSDEPSYWVTAAVLRAMAQLHSLGYLPAEPRLRQLITEALKYADGEMGRKVVKNRSFYDIDFASWRPQLEAYAPMTPSARKAVSNTVQHLIASWRDLSLEQKAEAALILNANNYPTTARSIIASLSEYEAWQQTGPCAPLLRAFAAVAPHSPEVDLIRQQFIEHKNAMDWGSSAATTSLVAALLSTGSNWLVPAANQWHVALNGSALNPAANEVMGAFRLNLPQGGELTISKGRFPAWGGVYASAVDSLSAIKPFSSPELSITRRIEGELKVGERVTMVVEIKASRPMDFCVVSLPACAAFEPVEQLPGRVWLAGTSAYREPTATATTYFLHRLQRGSLTLREDYYVTASGALQLAPAQVQSQYAPALRAHTASDVLTVKQIF